MQDTRVLEAGLSSCYIPHHAIVYYNEKNEPVAWMSICFMCSAIRKYHPVQKENSSEPNYNKKTEQKAIAQLEELKKLILETGLPVFNGPAEYLKYEKSLNEEKKSPVTITMTNDALIADLFSYKISHLNLQEFISKTGEDIAMKEDVKYTDGGDKYYFYTGTYKASVFNFIGTNENNSILDHAIVKDPEVKIIKGIFTGMSFDDFLGLTIYDGPSDPDIVTITNTDNTKTIILHFVDKQLLWYEIMC
jgi:hypothetical protein